jgi:LPXTG-motif cell wall-anchored protein
MSYCPKCGNKVEETMTFCPRCGASLTIEQAPTARPMPPPAYARNEKNEKNEKGEKNEKKEPEKGEKHEKGEYGYVGWLIGGIIVILIGLFGVAEATGFITGRVQSALVLLAIGIAVILIAVWFATRSRKRNPAPPA